MQNSASPADESGLRKLARGWIATILLPFLLSLTIFAVVAPSATDLPVLGDGTFHTFIMDSIADSGSTHIDVEVPYPLFYHLFGGLVDLLFGVTGVKLISPIMMALAGLIVYLIALELMQNRLAGLVAMLLIAFSAKLLHYDAQIYMEPFSIFFVLAAIYSALLFYKRQSRTTLVLLALCIGMAISSKQQMVCLMLAIPLFLLLNRVPLRKIAVLLGLALLFALGPYLSEWQATGGLSQPPTVGSIFESIPAPSGAGNTLLERLHLEEGTDSVPQWSKELDQESDSSELYEQVTSDHESRHIYFWNMINPVKFLELNSLHPYQSLGEGFGGPFHVFLRLLGFQLLQILLISGFLFALGYSIKHREWRIVPSIVLVSWLFTYWGSDTERYFLYLPVFMAFLYPWPIVLASRNFALSKQKVVLMLLSLAAAACALYVVQSGLSELDNVSELKMTQCYHPSEGGIASIKDVGQWIKGNSDETDRIFGTSTYEWTYYSDREVWHDYRICELDKDRVDHYLKLWNIKYVIVRDNQILSVWTHLQYYPQTFVDTITGKEGCNYPLVYTSSYNDIRVYEVK